MCNAETKSTIHVLGNWPVAQNVCSLSCPRLWKAPAIQPGFRDSLAYWDEKLDIENRNKFFIVALSLTISQPDHYAVLISRHWSAPSAGMYKINFDGTVFSSLKARGIGVFMHNHNVCITAAITKKETWGIGAEMNKIWAAKRVLELAAEMERLNELYCKVML